LGKTKKIFPSYEGKNLPISSKKDFLFQVCVHSGCFFFLTFELFQLFYALKEDKKTQLFAGICFISFGSLSQRERDL